MQLLRAVLQQRDRVARADVDAGELAASKLMRPQIIFGKVGALVLVVVFADGDETISLSSKILPFAPRRLIGAPCSA